MRRHPEVAAAVLNGCLVLFVPLVLLAVGPFLFDGNTNSSVTVRAPGASIVRPLLVLVQTTVILIPFALLAGWRTFVHAKKWREGVATGWRGVAESGATALGVVLIVLAPGIVTRATEAPPYVLIYGGMALIMGLVVGVMLRTTALLFLRLSRMGLPDRAVQTTR